MLRQSTRASVLRPRHFQKKRKDATNERCIPLQYSHDHLAGGHHPRSWLVCRPDQARREKPYFPFSSHSNSSGPVQFFLSLTKICFRASPKSSFPPHLPLKRRV